MRQRVWYLRRAVPWAALLGCCTGAVLVALLLAWWPSTALVMLPTALATCAAAAAFLFDEPAPLIAAVTPRGGSWGPTARLGVVLVPLLAWFLIIAVRPGALPLVRETWWLIGAALTLATAGLAALASRHGVGAPGPLLAAVVVLMVLGLVVVGLFVEAAWVYPFGDLTAGVRAFWLVMLGAGVLGCATGLRSRARR